METLLDVAGSGDRLLRFAIRGGEGGRNGIKIRCIGSLARDGSSGGVCVAVEGDLEGLSGVERALGEALWWMHRWKI